MSLEPMISIADAARMAGITRHTLRRWLQVDLGITFYPPVKGAKRLIKKSDFELLLRMHSGKVNWTKAREGSWSRAHKPEGETAA